MMKKKKDVLSEIDFGSRALSVVTADRPDPNDPTCAGLCNWMQGKIVLLAGMHPDELVEVLHHEITHGVDAFMCLG